VAIITVGCELFFLIVIERKWKQTREFLIVIERKWKQTRENAFSKTLKFLEICTLLLKCIFKNFHGVSFNIFSMVEDINPLHLMHTFNIFHNTTHARVPHIYVGGKTQRSLVKKVMDLQ